MIDSCFTSRRELTVWEHHSDMINSYMDSGCMNVSVRVEIIYGQDSVHVSSVYYL